MKRNTDKSFKRSLAKCLAFLMGVCYLANPLHEQIRTVFHEISHMLEAPDTFLSHHSIVTDHDHKTHHDHGMHPEYEAHQDQHRLSVNDHEHSFLDLLDSVLKASDEDHPEDDSLLSSFTFDKHINPQEHPIPPMFPSHFSQNTSVAEQKTKIGYNLVLEEPPRLPFPSL
ncbi:MAG: hypothetical protein WA913_11520 [Pricia sp.]